MSIEPTNLGKPATLHVEAIIGDRQIGIAVVDGWIVQCVNRKWSHQNPKPGMTVDEAANGIAEMLLAKGGIKFV